MFESQHFTVIYCSQVVPGPVLYCTIAPSRHRDSFPQREMRRKKRERIKFKFL